MISQLQTKGKYMCILYVHCKFQNALAIMLNYQYNISDLNKYNYSLDVKRMYFIRLWIMSTTYKLQTYFFSVASRYLGSKLFDSIKNVKNGLVAFERG